MSHPLRALGGLSAASKKNMNMFLATYQWTSITVYDLQINKSKSPLHAPPSYHPQKNLNDTKMYLEHNILNSEYLFFEIWLYHINLDSGRFWICNQFSLTDWSYFCALNKWSIKQKK